ncbi:gliding motility-associated protein GldE [Aureibaculum sp. 2210JD6-5]|uniref:gliding motility-associated protein GldE n=1 Tax=Aureibaculum sp. 2210JD6-5 TaxID=3103957 RepID=UPI002AAD2B85|nr:gliding motility-associated protein GldE [Aureibaculum sp. 2210JD6-5]MDY7394929.1 gliding motility-associated protein GldE [Aureibaculum sp. 2210JD6-5]
MDPEPASLFILTTIDWSFSIGIIALFSLLLISALVSGSEVAFFSLSKTALNEAEDSKKTVLVSALLERPKKLLATILITNNFINILIVLLFAYLGDFFFSGITNLGIRFLLEVILVTFLILLFGEVLPKVYANRNALKFASLMVTPINILSVLLTPLSVPLLNFTSIIEKRLGKKNSDFSVETLSQALELTSEEGSSKQEQKILQGIVTFGNTETVHVMCPRTDVFALPESDSFTDVVAKIIKNGHSRIPVYEENIDEITGILYSKDLLPHLNKKTFNWKKVIRQPFFVPENKKLDDLLREFQEMKNHLAIVVDEYGGTSGIVTLEDVIEEIVGDISDEFDDNDLNYSKLDINNYVFEGKIALKDFYKVLKVDDSIFEENKGEAETLAGFILEINEKFPQLNEQIIFNDYKFKIEVLDKKRIKQIKVTKPDVQNVTTD